MLLKVLFFFVEHDGNDVDYCMTTAAALLSFFVRTSSVMLAKSPNNFWSLIEYREVVEHTYIRLWKMCVPQPSALNGGSGDDGHGRLFTMTRKWPPQYLVCHERDIVAENGRSLC